MLLGPRCTLRSPGGGGALKTSDAWGAIPGESDLIILGVAWALEFLKLSWDSDSRVENHGDDTHNTKKIMQLEGLDEGCP